MLVLKGCRQGQGDGTTDSLLANRVGDYFVAADSYTALGRMLRALKLIRA